MRNLNRKMSEEKSTSQPEDPNKYIIPPASELGRYEHVLPGLADRIVRMAESEQNHRLFIDRLEIRLYWGLKILSYTGVFVLVGAMVYGSYILFEAGSVTGGIASAVGALTTVLVSIIKGANKRGSSD